MLCCAIGDRFFLEDNNTPPDIRDDRGDTPLNVAAYAGQPAAVEELLRQGADINAKNNKARSMVDYSHVDILTKEMNKKIRLCAYVDGGDYPPLRRPYL